MVFSLLGIDSTRSHRGIHNRGYRWREGDATWIALPNIPGPGRLAANAVALRGEPYVLGGYSVAESGKETSHSSLQRFNLKTGTWVSMAPLPIPIDDAGVAVWKDRYIIVVSGWSNTDNTDRVQIYDVNTDSWTFGTAFPGKKVFGPSMALSGNELLFIDGVTSTPSGFQLVNQVWKGTMDPSSPGTIFWKEIGQHPGPARYRAAPITTENGEVWFHGGTEQPYNFDGMRYDNGKPSIPLASTLQYAKGEFTVSDIASKPEATMDHRAMVSCGKKRMSVGGMTSGPDVTAHVWVFQP